MASQSNIAKQYGTSSELTASANNIGRKGSNGNNGSAAGLEDPFVDGDQRQPPRSAFDEDSDLDKGKEPGSQQAGAQQHAQVGLRPSQAQAELKRTMASQLETQRQMLSQKAAGGFARGICEAVPAPPVANLRHDEREQIRAAFTESLRRARAITLGHRASPDEAVREHSKEGVRHPVIPFQPVTAPQQPIAVQDRLLLRAQNLARAEAHRSRARAAEQQAAADRKRHEQEKQASTKAATVRPQNPPSATAVYLDHSSAPRISTDTVIARALKTQYPSLELTIVNMNNCQLLSYAAAGHAVAQPVADSDADPANLSWKHFLPPARHLDGGNGALGEQPLFAKYLYRWSSHEFIVYLVDGRDGGGSYPQVRNFYILSSEPRVADRLILEAGKWSDDLHEEILVFDQGNWTKSKELYASVRHARWEDVILDEGMKKAVIEDHLSFFRSHDTYTGLKVPWKRGVIYHGPPGNGKTISIKATMNMLYRQTPEIPTLYVRTLTSFMGPEYSVRLIFAYARRYAPCYLVFEDLDTIVSDSVRSYFLNEVDGLKSNDGIFMVGSTNHLDRLDPGISKRPSRFDRKYYFPDPNLEQRIAYCHFWQRKLSDSDEVEFPDKLCKAIADITDKFSFAYMQEAFVAALLAIARKSDSNGHGVASPGGSEDEWVGVDTDDEYDGVIDDDGDDDDDDDLDKYVLWVEMKKQVAILREGMEDKS